MTAEKPQGIETTHSASTDDARESRLTLQSLSESELWEYALNPPNPDEQDQILLRLAFDPVKQERLREIRQTIAAGARRESVIAAVRQRASEKLQALGLDLSRAAAVFVRIGDELVEALGIAKRDSNELSFQPVTLGGERGGDSDETIGQLTGPKGMSLELRPLSGGLFEIAVNITPAIEGKVALFQLEAKGGEEAAKQIGVRVALKNGQALLPSCPTGILKISAPDSCEMIICLESDRQ